jgi:7,8-dihydropterin-6-yl-methyl-4-(beta-D-ribofuranosyl)aminobenzene 5'-phosphate synthase
MCYRGATEVEMLEARRLRLTTIAENTATRSGIVGEWGLSILIEDGEHRFLLDTGAGASTVANADSLGIELDGIDAIVLSHGHNDHTGGLLPVLSRLEGGARVVAHPAVWGAKYSRNRTTNRYRYAGIPHAREALESAGARFELTEMPTWLSADIVASGEEPMTTDFEATADTLHIRTPDGFAPDPVIDDQSLYIRTDLGLVVVLGCAHRGMVNIIRHGCRLTATEKVYMVVGGTHLGSAAEPQVARTIEALREMDIGWLGVSHCTGLATASRLDRELPGRFLFSNAGTTISFPFAP